MELSVRGSGPTAPFLRAQDRFETAHDLNRPVEVRIRRDPDERTWAGHHDDCHVLNISRQAAASAMATELALHEYAHMLRHEESHPSHTQEMGEVLFLALAGHEVERRKIAHCYQIANHVKDIYADDITLDVGPTEKLVTFLESQLATAVADRPPDVPSGWHRTTPAADPEITAINAAFAVALLERHDALPPEHRIYDLADVAAGDAPAVDLSWFKHHFERLEDDPDESSHRKALVAAVEEYVVVADRRAAD